MKCEYKYFLAGVKAVTAPYVGKPSYPYPLQGYSHNPLDRPAWTKEARIARRKIYAKFVRETRTDAIYGEIFDLEAERLLYLRDMRRY